MVVKWPNSEVVFFELTQTIVHTYMGMIHIHSRYIVQVLVYLDFGLVSSLLVQFATVAKLATEMISSLRDHP